MKQRSSGNLKKYKDIIARVPLTIFLNNLSAIVNSLSVASILDLGCGEGLAAKHLLSKNKGLSVTGVDINDGAIAMARVLCPGASFKKADIYNLDYKQGSFDLILAIEVLEHLDDPGAAIQKIKQMAGRYCIFTVPLEPYFMLGNLIRGRHILRLGNPEGHIWHWRRKDFNNLLLGYFNRVDIKIVFPWMLALCREG